MATAAITTMGIALKRESAPDTFTLIPEVYSLNGPSESNKQVDVTSFDSTAREYIGALPDGGEISFECNYVPGNAQHQGLHTDFAARTVGGYKIELTDAATTPTTIAFDGLITAFSLKAGIDDRVTLSCTVKVSGTPTYTYHSA